jgi:phosphoglycerol transferase MdoB-like AlkP superfamily enzyme
MIIKNFSFYFSLLRIYLFWLVFFALERLYFIIFDFVMIKNSGAGMGEVLQAFWYAIPLDLSMASYYAAISWLILSLQNFYNHPLIDRVHKYIQWFLITINSLIAVGNIGIYPEWKMKLNFKALEYLSRPAEVLESNQTSKSIFEVLIMIVIISFSIWLFNRFYFKKTQDAKPNIIAKIGFIIIVPVLVFLGMRGGLKEIPISQSQSYYSQKDVMNDLAVNSTWNLMYSILNTMDISDRNVFETYDDEEAFYRVQELHEVSKDTTISILNIDKPNVVFIIMESWSGDLVHALGGRSGLTPRFDSLINEGYFFNHLYSSGNRSQQGLASILGGFPALPITTLTTTPEKMRQTATITRLFNAASYHSAFYYGGQLRYGNIKAYLMHNQFQTIIEDADISKKIPRGKLGIHDGYMFPFVLDKINNLEQPFFVNYFTLTSHSPYDQPMKPVIDWGDSEDKFHNSVYYTDSVLGDFMEEAKKQAWYANTLIVIVADHSHQTYTHRSIYEQDYRHIPMLLMGGALKKEYRGAVYENVCSQTDLVTTLLKQLNMDASAFPWSKNLMNPYTPEFAYFELNQGFGWIRPEGYLSFDHFNQRYLENTFIDSLQQQKEFQNGASYLQVLFQEYIDL